MLENPVFQRFLKRSPICVMVRAALENVFAPRKLQALFEQAAQAQYERELLFSTVVDIMSLVVCRVQPSVHAAYQERRQEIAVSVKALYDKLSHVEPDTSRALVQHAAREAATLIQGLPTDRPPLLPGYRLRILDGNHLQGTQHRLGPLRTTGGGALPGLCLAVLDPDLGLIVDVLPCEEAYAQECRLAEELWPLAQPRDVYIDDRQFCTSALLFGLASRQACFVTRQHAGHLRWEASGERRCEGRTDTGQVWEERVTLIAPGTDERLSVRRVTLVLDQPTRDGEHELSVLTNLPRRTASARRVAELYRDRWRIETAFQEMTLHLRCELNTLGYPRAALFGFATAAACFNVFAVIQAALGAAHGDAVVREEVSHYYLAEELAGTYRGMMIALPEDEWSWLAALSPGRLSGQLRTWAAGIDLSRYRKHKRGPKQRVQRPEAPGAHFSTARLLAKTKRTTKKPPPK